LQEAPQEEGSGGTNKNFPAEQIVQPFFPEILQLLQVLSQAKH